MTIKCATPPKLKKEGHFHGEPWTSRHRSRYLSSTSSCQSRPSAISLHTRRRGVSAYIQSHRSSAQDASKSGRSEQRQFSSFPSPHPFRPESATVLGASGETEPLYLFRPSAIHRSDSFESRPHSRFAPGSSVVHLASMGTVWADVQCERALFACRSPRLTPLSRWRDPLGLPLSLPARVRATPEMPRASQNSPKPHLVINAHPNSGPCVSGAAFVDRRVRKHFFLPHSYRALRSIPMCTHVRYRNKTC